MPRSHVDLRDGSTRLISVIEKCGYEGYNHKETFDGFLDFVEYQLDRFPSLFNQLAQFIREHQHPPTVEQVDQFPEPADLKPRWTAIQKRWKVQTLRHFAEGFAILLSEAEDGEGEATYADCLGEAYQNFVYSSTQSARGQFFSPEHVCELMARNTVGEEADAEAALAQRIDEQIAQSEHARRLLAIGELMGARITLQTRFNALNSDPSIKYRPLTVADDAGCGSGRMLLAGARQFPRWAVIERAVEFYGCDIDQRCVQMTIINVRLYGLNGTGYILEESKPTAQKAIKQGKSQQPLLFPEFEKPNRKKVYA